MDLPRGLDRFARHFAIRIELHRRRVDGLVRGNLAERVTIAVAGVAHGRRAQLEAAVRLHAHRIEQLAVVVALASGGPVALRLLGLVEFQNGDLDAATDSFTR